MRDNEGVVWERDWKRLGAPARVAGRGGAGAGQQARGERAEVVQPALRGGSSLGAGREALCLPPHYV